MRNHPDYKLFWQKYEKIKKEKSEYASISEIIPPYSIHILCKLGKFAGEFTSSIKIINLLIQINNEIFDNINLLYFEFGLISKRQILNKFCEIYEKDIGNNQDLFEYDNKYYSFKKGGIIFISLRLGIYKLEDSYRETISWLFKAFHNNIGFVCGKNNRAYYFIGIVGKNKLIFADPHINQQVKNTSDKDYESYSTENIYLVDVKELSSEIMFAIKIFDMQSIKTFFEDVNILKKLNNGEIIIFSEQNE